MVRFVVASGPNSPTILHPRCRGAIAILHVRSRVARECCLCVRRAFRCDAPVASATLYLTARGVVEARISGQRVGDDLFAPEWTDYNKRIQYRTYDVTKLLKPGENAIGVMLGDGWWSGYVGWQETRADAFRSMARLYEE